MSGPLLKRKSSKMTSRRAFSCVRGKAHLVNGWFVGRLALMLARCALKLGFRDASTKSTDS